MSRSVSSPRPEDQDGVDSDAAYDNGGDDGIGCEEGEEVSEDMGEVDGVDTGDGESGPVRLHVPAERAAVTHRPRQRCRIRHLKIYNFTSQNLESINVGCVPSLADRMYMLRGRGVLNSSQQGMQSQPSYATMWVVHGDPCTMRSNVSWYGHMGPPWINRLTDTHN